MIRSSFFRSFAMRLFGAGLGFLTTILLSRLLGVSEFGAYSLAIGWLSIAALFTTLGFQHFTVRAIPPLVTAGRSAEILGLLIFAFLLSGLLALIATLAAPALIEYLDPVADQSMKAAVVAVAVLILPVTVNQVRQGVLRGFASPIEGQAPELVIQPAILLVLVVAAALLGSELSAKVVIGFVLVSALISGAAGLVWLVIRAREFAAYPPVLRPQTWLAGAGKSFFLFAAGTIMSSTDLVMLGYLSDATETGIYGVAGRFFFLMMLPTLAVSSGISHEISRLYHARRIEELESAVRGSAGHAAIMTGAIAIACTAFALQVELVFGPGFAGASVPILILVWMRASEAALGQPAMVLANSTYTGLAGLTVFGAVIVNVVLNGLLIPTLGATGAALATGAAHLMMAGTFVFLVRRKIGIVSFPRLAVPFWRDG